MLQSSAWVLACLCSCASPQEKSAASPFDLAVERCRSNDEDGALAALAEALEAEPGAVQRALLEPAFRDLRDSPALPQRGARRGRAAPRVASRAGSQG